MSLAKALLQRLILANAEARPPGRCLEEGGRVGGVGEDVSTCMCRRAVGMCHTPLESSRRDNCKRVPTHRCSCRRRCRDGADLECDRRGMPTRRTRTLSHLDSTVSTMWLPSYFCRRSLNARTCTNVRTHTRAHTRTSARTRAHGVRGSGDPNTGVMHFSVFCRRLLPFT